MHKTNQQPAQRRVSARSKGLFPGRATSIALAPEPEITELLGCVARVILRAGYDREQIVRIFESECQHVPQGIGMRGQGLAAEKEDAAHVLTLWYSDKRYIERGTAQPRCLRLRGPEPSFSTLVSHVNPDLNVKKTAEYLLRVGAVVRESGGYRARKRMVELRGYGAPNHARSLRTLQALVRTLDHNERAHRSIPGWFEYTAVHGNYPVSAIPATDEFVRRTLMTALNAIDASLERRAAQKRLGERTIRYVVGAYASRGAVERQVRRTRGNGHENGWD